jgi:hypothetical protein
MGTISTAFLGSVRGAVPGGRGPGMPAGGTEELDAGAIPGIATPIMVPCRAGRGASTLVESGAIPGTAMPSIVPLRKSKAAGGVGGGFGTESGAGGPGRARSPMAIPTMVRFALPKGGDAGG